MKHHGCFLESQRLLLNPMIMDNIKVIVTISSTPTDLTCSPENVFKVVLVFFSFTSTKLSLNQQSLMTNRGPLCQPLYILFFDLVSNS